MDNQLNPTNITQDKFSTVLEIPIPHEFKLMQSVRRIPGHILFGWNPNTGEIKPIEYAKVEATLDVKTKKTLTHFRVNQDKELNYLQAMNLKNARKKVLKFIERVKAAA